MAISRRNRATGQVEFRYNGETASDRAAKYNISKAEAADQLWQMRQEDKEDSRLDYNVEASTWK